MVFLAMLVYQRNTFNIVVVGMDHQPLPRLVTGLLMLQIRPEKKLCSTSRCYSPYMEVYTV